MNIFLSWSGDRSKAIAEAFRDWLPKVLQATRPWMSDADIDKGAKWDAEISSQLVRTNFGIIYLTPENRFSPAMHFEAGALSKYVQDARLWTYLFDLTHTEVKWPLSEFQHTKSEKEDTKRLLLSVNVALGEQSLGYSDFADVYETWWPKLENRLQRIAPAKEIAPSRSEKDLIEEILELTRKTSQTMSSIQPYEPLSAHEIRGLVVALWNLINKCDELGITDSLIRQLRSLRTSVQYVTNRTPLPAPDAKYIYDHLNKVLLKLDPQIRTTRSTRM